MTRAPGAGLLLVPHRTARFTLEHLVALRSLNGGANGHGPPLSKLSLSLAGWVAFDEAVLGLMKSPRMYPKETDYEPVVEELRAATAFYDAQGWLTDPVGYHLAPPPLGEPVVRQARARGVAFERLTWRSGYMPRENEPGAERWASYTRNQTAHAWVLRGHPGAPWLVCLHGFGMGVPMMDLFAFRAQHLCEELGVNLVMPVLPLHGARRASAWGGVDLMSFQIQNFVLGMAQAMWDVRRVLSWVRAQGASKVGVYGMSLGAYAASLLATLEPDLDLVIAGAPVSNIPKLFALHAPPKIRVRALDLGLLTTLPECAMKVVSPLARAPVVPRDNLAIFAGTVDRMAGPDQAHTLWKHWGEPTIDWYHGGHMTFLWSVQVARFVEDRLRALA